MPFNYEFCKSIRINTAIFTNNCNHLWIFHQIREVYFHFRVIKCAATIKADRSPPLLEFGYEWLWM
jgi:hypothetical protein